MGGITIAWLAGLGIVTYRWVKQGAPPTPGSLALASGYFVLLAILAEYQPARTTAGLLAAGIDIAALLQVLPGTKAPAAATGWPPAQIPSPSTTFLPGQQAASSSSGKSSSSGSSSSGSSGIGSKIEHFFF